MKRRSSPLSERTLQLALFEDSDISCDSEELPSQKKFKPSVCRNLFEPSPSGNTGQDVCRTLFEPSTSGNTGQDVVEVLETRLKEYRVQWAEAQKSNLKVTMRRKVRRIRQFEQLIQDSKMGKNIDIKCVPNPFESPLRKKPTISVDCSETNTEKGNGATMLISLTSPDDGLETELQNAVDLRKPETMKRKENFCMVCKKLVKEFCKHYERVHCDTEEGKKLNDLNNIADKAERKLLKTRITDMLRKKGNEEYNKMSCEEFQCGRDVDVIPVKRSSKYTSNQNNTVQCAHCKGYYKRRKFSQHLKTCKDFLKLPQLNKAEGHTCSLKYHSIPVLHKIEGASNQLINDILTNMQPRTTKDVAMRDPLIMKYASEFHKTRREVFQKTYVSRIITDLSRLLMRIQEIDENITCMEDVFNPANFSMLVKCILQEAGYDDEKGNVDVCGLGNRLRSHIKGAAETAKKEAAISEFKDNSSSAKMKRKRIKQFLKLLEEKWANEIGRVFDTAVKQSRSEKEPKLAAEEDIVKTCQFIASKYKPTIITLQNSNPKSIEKQKAYNSLLDLLITHIMCLIRRRPVDFKRAKNFHYEKMDKQDDLINEIKNSKHMHLSESDLNICNKFKIFYVPGKGWKEMVPIALTKLMKEAMDVLQQNKEHVGITSETLFVRSNEMPINPRECLRKVTKGLNLKKPMDLSGNGLRHHAGTFSKLHSSHPNYQDYLASALGHSLHIHKLHYEMPTSVVQKLIVCPVLEDLTKPVNERQDSKINEESNTVICNVNELTTTQSNNDFDQSISDASYNLNSNDREKTPESDTGFDQSSSSQPVNVNKSTRVPWSEEEKKLMYEKFGESILNHTLPSRKSVKEFFIENRSVFSSRSVASLLSFLQSKCNRKAKNVTPDVKRILAKTNRRITNVPL